MTCYSIETRDRIFVKRSGLLSFAKNKGKQISKNLLQTQLKLFQKEQFEKNASKETGDLIINKITNKITKNLHRVVQRFIRKQKKNQKK